MLNFDKNVVKNDQILRSKYVLKMKSKVRKDNQRVHNFLAPKTGQKSIFFCLEK